MTDCPDQQIKELLERIAQLESQVAGLAERPIIPDSLAAMITRLDGVLRPLETKVKFLGHDIVTLSQDFVDERAAQADRFQSAFERIKGLERSVFPNLLADIESVYQIIGGEGVPAQPNALDVRKPETPEQEPRVARALICFNIRMGVDDPDQAVRKVYFEYLGDRYKDDLVNMRHRERQFNNGHPAQGDLNAIEAAREAYVEAAGSGQALDRARDALYGWFDREHVKRREVDPIRYRKDAEYHERMNSLIDKRVEETRVERHRKHKAQLELAAEEKSKRAPQMESPKADHTPEGSSELQPAREKISWRRLILDSDYRRSVLAQQKKEPPTVGRGGPGLEL